MRILILLFATLMLAGCLDDKPAPREKVEGPAVTLPAKTAEQAKVEELQKQLVDAEKAATLAAVAGKTTERLMNENTALGLRTQIAEQEKIQLDQYLTSLRNQTKENEKALEKSRISDWQWRLYYAAMILGALAVIACVVYFVWDLLDTPAKWAMGIFGGLAVAVTVIAKLLPYIVWFIDFIPYLLWPIGVVIGIYGIAALRHWWLTTKTSNQFATLIPKLKAAGINIEQHMQNELDSPVLAHIERIGKKITARVSKMPPPIQSPPAPPTAGTPT